MTALAKLISSTEPRLWFMFKHSATVKYFPIPKSYYLKGRLYKNEEKYNSTLLHKPFDASTSYTSQDNILTVLQIKNHIFFCEFIGRCKNFTKGALIF
jgi:hypothetical protein